MSVAENLQRIRSLVPDDVEIVAVSKFHPSSMIEEAYEAGQRVFGESRVQEFLEKERILPKDIRWHFIGHLQTNKVKQLIGKTSLIESVDSEKLFDLINKESVKAGVVTDLLLQVHVAAEETKFGFYPEELKEFLNRIDLKDYPGVSIRGLMGMATNTDDTVRVKKDFATIHDLFVALKNAGNLELKNFDKLSMGMSGDWAIAVSEGANIVRIGSAIFGEREY